MGCTKGASSQWRLGKNQIFCPENPFITMADKVHTSAAFTTSDAGSSDNF